MHLYDINGRDFFPAGRASARTAVAVRAHENVSFGTGVNGPTYGLSGELEKQGGASTAICSDTLSGIRFKPSGIALPLTLSAGQASNFTVGFNPAASGSVPGSVIIK